MTDLSLTVAAKSEQLTAEDLQSGPRTVRVTHVSACPDSAEQPISISFDGDDGRPYKPCKLMRRVLIHVWGKDGGNYAGRSLTLYRDPNVQFGGLKVGGIRISHASHIDEPMTIALMVAKAKLKPFKVQPMQAVHEQPASDPAKDWADKIALRFGRVTHQDTYNDIIGEGWFGDGMARLRDIGRVDLCNLIEKARMAALARITDGEGEKPDPLDAVVGGTLMP